MRSLLVRLDDMHSWCVFVAEVCGGGYRRLELGFFGFWAERWEIFDLILREASGGDGVDFGRLKAEFRKIKIF